MNHVSENRPTLEHVSETLDGLNNAIIEHTKWMARWSRNAICDIPIAKDYLSTESHQSCEFGKWYYSGHHDFLKENIEFTALEHWHNAMHENVRRIAEKLNAGEKLPTREFDLFLRHEGLFATSLAKLRDDLLGLSHSYDFLTGTLNRQAFFQLLSQEYARIKRTKEPCCLVMVDLDYFKKINDEHGHQAGDAVLHFTADYLNENLRPYDLICRYGGEEFLVCLPNTAADTACSVIERLRERISKKKIPINKDAKISVTASFGIALLSADENWSMTIEHADAAMYQAKTQGRNRVIVWKEDS